MNMEKARFEYRMASLLLLLQSERPLDAADFLREALVDLQTLLDGVAAVNDCRVIAVTNQLADTGSRHLGVFLSQIHRDLTHLHVVTPTALADNQMLGDIEVLAHLLKDIVDRERMVVDLHSTLDDTLCQTHINIGVIDNRIGHQRIDHALQFAHTTIAGLSDILNHRSRNLQTVTTALGIQDVDAELHRRFLQFSNQTAGESRQHTLVQPFQIHRRTVTGKNNLLTQTEQMVEDMEERCDRLLSRCPLLHVIDNQHINCLIEVDKVIDRILSAGIGKLHLEQTGADIEHTLLRIHLLAAHANCIDQVRLATPRRTIDEEGVKGGLSRMLRDGETHRTWQLVGIALDEILEGLLGIQLGIESLWNSGIERCGRLIATTDDLWNTRASTFLNKPT